MLSNIGVIASLVMSVCCVIISFENNGQFYSEEVF
jgi:hypothetical protein